MPPAIEQTMPVGCLAVLGIYLTVCVAVFWLTKSGVAVTVALPALLLVAAVAVKFLYGLALLLAVRRRWSRRGVRCLVVYSNSPAWETHIRTTWLPRLGDVAVAINWSERASWTSTLAVRVFKRFCGQYRNFNPAVVVFRGLRRPYVFRFYNAFREAKAGRPQYLERLQTQLFDALGIGGKAA